MHCSFCDAVGESLSLGLGSSPLRSAWPCAGALELLRHAIMDWRPHKPKTATLQPVLRLSPAVTQQQGKMRAITTRR